MVKTGLVTLLLVVLMATHADCWGRIWRSPFVKGVAVGAVLGKRDSPPSCPELTADQVDQQAADLAQACAGLDKFKDVAVSGLSQRDVQNEFLASDDNGDGLLFGAELDEYTSAIQLIDNCASVEQDAEAAKAA